MLKDVSDFTKELLNYVQSAPGWIPLTATCYYIYNQLKIDDINIAENSLKEHKELLVVISVIILYALGDALDKSLFKYLIKIVHPNLNGYKSNATIFLFDKNLIYKKSIHIKQDSNDFFGIYKVSKGLSIAAGAYNSLKIGFQNEAAKFLRSLIIPMFIGSFYLMYSGKMLVSIIPILIGLLLLFSYVFLKGNHMKNLYLFVSEGINKKKEEMKIKAEIIKKGSDRGKELRKVDMLYSTSDNPNGIRHFFWNGHHIESGFYAQNK